MIEGSQATPEIECDSATRDACACRLCGNTARNRVHLAREMFLGTRDRFAYVECDACGTLQLRDVPDLSRYYPADYYSLSASDDDSTPSHPARRIARSLGASLRRASAAYLCARREPCGAARHPFGWLATRLRSKTARDFPAYLKETRLRLKFDQSSAVLDVGSGAGSTLLLLRRFGFRDLTGVDPFLNSDILYEGGVRVMKGEARDLRRQFDLVLANHSLEHTPDPLASLRDMNRLLKVNRYAIVRLPIVARAWHLYKTDWVQLDAPRHLFLFKPATFRALAEDAGFAVEEVRFDSTAFQFWGSEQYARDIPLADPRSYFVDPTASPFAPEEIAAWEAKAARWNARGEGDQAIFYLRRK